MTKDQVIQQAETQIVQGELKIKQAELATGITVLVPRTKFGGMLEKHYARHGKGWSLTNTLREAAKGLPGIEIIQFPNKRVFVRITGL